jgi:hypothetical protein
MLLRLTVSDRLGGLFPLRMERSFMFLDYHTMRKVQLLCNPKCCTPFTAILDTSVYSFLINGQILSRNKLS